MTCCSECDAQQPRGVAYTHGWFTLTFGDGTSRFCSAECLHLYTVGMVAGEGFMFARRTQ